MTIKPNPGTKEAQELGCKCPVLDNEYGRGIIMDGEICFWYSADCEVHCADKA